MLMESLIKLRNCIQRCLYLPLISLILGEFTPLYAQSLCKARNRIYITRLVYLFSNDAYTHLVSGRIIKWSNLLLIWEKWAKLFVFFSNKRNTKWNLSLFPVYYSLRIRKFLPTLLFWVYLFKANFSLKG